MTRLSQENVKGKYYLGRKVVDNYGGSIGKVVGYYSKAKNSSLIVGLELTNGIFKAIQSSQLIDEANVFVLDENRCKESRCIISKKCLRNDLK